MKNKLILSLIALVGLSYGAFHLVADQNDSDQPPSIDIDFGGNKFGGRLSNNVGCALPGEAFSQEDVQAFTKPDGRSYDLKRGLHLYHSAQDMSFADVIANIQPVKDNKLMVISYNPVNNPDKYFSVYPGFGEGAYFPVNNPERSFIARNNAFIIASCKDSKIWNVKTESMPASDVAGNIHDIDKGWILVATGADINYEDYPVSKAWPQTEEGPVFTMGLDHGELSEYVVRDNKYVMWIKVDKAAFVEEEVVEVVEVPAQVQPEEEPEVVEEAATPEPVQEQVEDEPAQESNNNWVNQFRNQAEVEEEVAPVVEEEPLIPYRPATPNYGLFGHQFDNGAEEEEADRDYSAAIQYAEQNAERVGELERSLAKLDKRLTTTRNDAKEAKQTRSARESELNEAKNAYIRLNGQANINTYESLRTAIAAAQAEVEHMKNAVENDIRILGTLSTERELEASEDRLEALYEYERLFLLWNEADQEVVRLETLLDQLNDQKREMESELAGLR